MSHLDDFLSLLCGRFDNARQLEELKQTGGPALPYAEHVNTICNDKIEHLPENFSGYFMVEESYYTSNGNTHAAPHLCLFTEDNEDVLLTSYDLPDDFDKNTFTYDNLTTIDYNALKPSEKFTPARYVKKRRRLGRRQCQHVLSCSQIHFIRALLRGLPGSH